jgi:hypothetical protein
VGIVDRIIGAGRRTAADSARSPWLERLGRAGLAAQGVSYGLVAVLALKLAFGAGGKATSRQGAFQTLAHDPFGKAVLIGLAIGFAGYAAWRFANALFDRKGRGEDPPGLAAWSSPRSASRKRATATSDPGHVPSVQNLVEPQPAALSETVNPGSDIS